MQWPQLRYRQDMAQDSAWQPVVNSKGGLHILRLSVNEGCGLSLSCGQSPVVRSGPRGSPHLPDHLPQGLEPGACLPMLFLDTALTIAIALATLYLVGRKSPIICWWCVTRWHMMVGHEGCLLSVDYPVGNTHLPRCLPLKPRSCVDGCRTSD